MDARALPAARISIALGALFLALFIFGAPAGAQEDEPALRVEFETVSLRGTADVSAQIIGFIEAGGDYRYVGFDADVLMDDLQAASRVDLELFDGTTFELTTAAAGDGVAGSRYWSATGSWVTADITELNGVLTGRIADIGNSALYRIVNVDGAVHVIARDQVVYPDEEEILADAPEAGSGTEGSGNDPAGSIAADVPQVDVLVWYDQGAVGIWGSEAVAEAELTSAFNNANNITALVGADVTFNVVELEAINWTPSTNPSTALGSIRNQTDGVLDEVHAARDAAGADLVAIIGNMSGACGIGYLPSVLPSAATDDLAFTYTDAACVGGNFSMIHEIGHNMGASHDVGASFPGPGLFSYSQGYVNPGLGYRTIMSYTTACSGCLRVGYFSNPTVTYNGNPTGDAGKDNARTLRETAAGVAAYRDGVDTTAPDTSITNPAANATVPGSGLVLDGNATDNVGVTRVRLTIYETGSYDTWNGSAFTSAFSTVDATLDSAGATSTGWSYAMSSPPDTEVVFTAVAYDGAGNFDGSQPWRLFTISGDTVDPNAEISTPAPGASESTSPVTLSGDTTDNVAVSRVRLTIYETDGYSTWNGTSFTAPFTTVDATVTEVPSDGVAGDFVGSWTYDMVNAPDTEVVFTALAYDAAGNTDLTKPWRLFTIDSSADTVNPDATIANPPSGASIGSSTITLDGSATDDVGISRVRLTIYETSGYDTWDGEAFTSAFSTVDATLTPNGTTGADWSYDLVGAPSTQVVFTAVAFDTSNNVDPTQPWRLFTIIPD